MRSEEKDSSDQYWQIESCNLQKAFDRKIRDLIESGEAHHFSIFGKKGEGGQPLTYDFGVATEKGVTPSSH